MPGFDALTNVTHVEIISDVAGRAFVKDMCHDVKVSMQDEGQMPKIFLKSGPPDQGGDHGDEGAR